MCKIKAEGRSPLPWQIHCEFSFLLNSRSIQCPNIESHYLLAFAYHSESGSYSQVFFNRSCAQVRPLKTKASLVQDADKHQGPEIFHGTFSAVKVFKTWVGSSHGESHGR